MLGEFINYTIKSVDEVKLGSLFTPFWNWSKVNKKCKVSFLFQRSQGQVQHWIGEIRLNKTQTRHKECLKVRNSWACHVPAKTKTHTQSRNDTRLARPKLAYSVNTTQQPWHFTQNYGSFAWKQVKSMDDLRKMDYWGQSYRKAGQTIKKREQTCCKAIYENCHIFS